MEKRPYTISYVRPALKWCLTYFTPEKTGKKVSEKMTQHQEWFETWAEADQRGHEATGKP